MKFAEGTATKSTSHHGHILHTSIIEVISFLAHSLLAVCMYN